jgi:hypothetical protein
MITIKHSWGGVFWANENGSLGAMYHLPQKGHRGRGAKLYSRGGSWDWIHDKPLPPCTTHHDAKRLAKVQSEA